MTPGLQVVASAGTEESSDDGALARRATEGSNRASNDLAADAVRLVCIRGYFSFLKREVNACSLVCRSWREALAGYPVDDILWRDCAWVRRFFPATNKFWQLRTLQLTGATEDVDPGPAARLHRLQTDVDSPLHDIRFQLQFVQSLSLTHSLGASASLSSIVACRNLKYLQLGSMGKHTNLDFVRNCALLDTLKVFEAESLSSLDVLGQNCKRLKEVTIRRAAHLGDVSGLQGCRELESLDLTGASSLETVEALRSCLKLRSLVLTGCAALKDVQATERLDSLEVVYLSGCDLVADVEPLRAKPHLNTLWLERCVSVRDLQPLTTCSSLRTLSIGGCAQLFSAEQVSLISKIKSLVELYASGLSSTLAPLAGRKARLFVTTDPADYRCTILARFGTR